MSEANVVFNNSSLNDDNGEEMEFQVGGEESLEHDFSQMNNKQPREYLNTEDEDPQEESNEIEKNELENILEEELEAELEDELDQLEQDQVKNAKEKIKDDNIVISKSKVVLIEKLLQNIRESNDRIVQLLSGSVRTDDEFRIGISQLSEDNFPKNKEEVEVEGRVIEGVFDGENMIGPDGKQYSMPANYASKSKLIEGDIMKLTITDSGTFVYKQIGPIERKRVVGIIGQSENGNFFVTDENGKKWRVLTASVTYYKGQYGDEAVILVPKNGDSKWAAVDNVVRNQE